MVLTDRVQKYIRAILEDMMQANNLLRRCNDILSQVVRTINLKHYSGLHSDSVLGGRYLPFCVRDCFLAPIILGGNSAKPGQSISLPVFLLINRMQYTDKYNAKHRNSL